MESEKNINSTEITKLCSAIEDCDGHNKVTDDAEQIRPLPFMCGICRETFGHLDLFFCHFSSHSDTNSTTFHVCDCIYMNNLASESNEENKIYKCRTCTTKFSSICSLHNHILNCSADGSYIFDNTLKMAYPLTIDCSYFETREDVCERVIDSARGKVDVEELMESEYNVSRAERVDQILRSMCRLSESEGKKQMGETTQVGIKERKRGRPKKYENFLSGVDFNTGMHATMAYKYQKKIKKITIKDKVTKTNRKRKEVKNKQDTLVDEIEQDKDVVVKVEVEEYGFCDRTENDHNGAVGNEDDNMTQEEMKVSEYHENFDDHDLDADTDDGDDDDDLTDEYAPEDCELDLISENEKYKDCQTGTFVKLVKKVIGKSGNIKEIKKRNIRKSAQDRSDNKTTPKKIREKSTAKPCPHCGKKLKPYKLKVHIVSHFDERAYKCDQCPKSYKYQGHLDSHKASHQEVKPYCCEVCGKGYITHTMMKHHWMMHHADTKPCMCLICGASFITNYKLKRHMRKHTGEKSVQCDLCGMGFSTRYNLSMHIQGVHKRNHKFTCRECGKHFLTNYQLKVHTMKHSGERPYKCIICKAEYIERKELRRHLKKQHDLPLEKNSSVLSDIPEVFSLMKDMERVSESKTAVQEITPVSDDDYIHVQERLGPTTSPEFIIPDSSGMYTYTSAEVCHSAQYFPLSKSTRGDISNVKVVQAAANYQIDGSPVQGFSLNNSTEGIPLTVHRPQGDSRFVSTVTDQDLVKDLSKNSEEKLGMHQNMNIYERSAFQDKNRTAGLRGPPNNSFTVL